ncbi:MAG: radical SAM protein [Candidatus Korarchaeum sp.]|jgi:radical SAM superfamily enzyme YgiQ (UPF0313 family)|nr:radical SAM protein [Candidatus Korarchaeum sp.]
MPIEEGGFYDRDPRVFELKVAIVYPGPYRVAVSSLGHQILYFMMNSIDGVMAERFVSDLNGSVESGRPLDEFDIVLATLHFEGQYPVLLRMIEGIKKPVLVGGPAVSFNPLPMSPLVSAVGLGDFEELIGEILKVKDEGIASLPPKFFVYELRNRAKFNRTPRLRPLRDQIRVVESGVTLNKFLLEISRGCGWGCRFCGIGWHWRPRLDAPISEVREAIEYASDLGFSEIYIIGSDAASSKAMKDVLWEIVERGLRASIPSIRADQVDSDLLDLIRRTGGRMITIAPETGSDRLKGIINKRIDNDEVIRIAEEAKDKGLRHIKLYFMIGLPFEQESDVIESVKLASKVNSIIRAKITLSVFVPKAGTPFELSPLVREIDFRRRASLFWKEFKEELNISHYGRAYVQALLSLGGFEMSEILRKGYKRPFNRWTYKSIARDLGIDADRIVYGERETPWWDYVDNIPKDFIRGEYERAKSGLPSPSCDEFCSECAIGCLMK